MFKIIEIIIPHINQTYVKSKKLGIALVISFIIHS